MLIQEILQQIQEIPTGPRSHNRKIADTLLSSADLDKAIGVVRDTIASGLISAKPVTDVCRNVSLRIHQLLFMSLPSDETLIDAGRQMLHWMASAGIIDVERYPIISSGTVKDQWYITSLSQEFTEYAIGLSPSSRMPSPLDGYQEWITTSMTKDDFHIPIVKKADRYKVMHLYAPDRMPDVYSSLNRLNKQSFIINKDILKTATSPDFPFIPRVITEEQRKGALRSINDVSRKAKWIEERQFEVMNKWLLKEAELDDPILANKISKKKASEESQDYRDTKAEPHLAIISDWSKRLDFDKIITLAAEWQYDLINYVFNCDTRGRIYAIQNFLTPLGSDLAKAMIVFDKEYQISGYDFCIHIANCFGQDKLSFADRVKWVNDNSYELQMIGVDPIANYNLIQQLELEGESKTRWQGIAACQVYVNYCEHIIEHGTEEGFMTSLIIGLDATASGTQILSILGRDDKVAPYVNISAPLENKVGDFYTFLSNYLKPKIESHQGVSLTLDAVLNEWSKYSRKLSKRNSMTFSYSGTKYGFGQQHWEDRHSYGPLGSELTRADCRILGNEMYDVCLENIRGGAEIMSWLRDGIDLHTDGAMISWTMPDGFTAFQVCDASKSKRLTGPIGTRTVTLVYYVFRNKPKKSAHKNGIAPNWVHSFDAYLLRLIVLGMPEEAPISTVHDQFSTCSYFIQELQDVAKDAYKVIGDREAAERICEDAFGTHRPLPLVGTWKLNEIDNAEFIIC